MGRSARNGTSNVLPQIGQRPLIQFANIAKNRLLTIGFVDWHPHGALEFANFMGGLRTLIQHLHQPAVEFIDFLAPVYDVHKRCQFLAVT